MIARRLTRLLVVLLALLATLPAQAGDLRPILIQQSSTDEPAEFFARAARQFSAGARDEAVFWFYVGQLRFRSLLAANPGLDPSGAPALFASLMESVGRPINEYAFGDIPALQRSIDAALAWDASNRDPALPAASHDRIRAGLVGLRDQIGRDAASIRAQRQQNGLENR